MVKKYFKIIENKHVIFFSCSNCYTFSIFQLLEAETMQQIFSNNYQLCSEISETVLHHFIHCLATHGRYIQYLNFLHTIIKAEGKYVKKCQDMIMTEVCQCDLDLIKLNIIFLNLKSQYFCNCKIWSNIYK